MFDTVLSTEALAAHLQAPDWVVFDCRFALDDPKWGRRAYRASHIPGAHYAHLDQDLAAPIGAGTGRHPLPEPEAFGRWLGRHGVDGAKQVVAYDQGGGGFAARLWWMLRWLGHDSVAVLDGGWSAWTAARGPESREVCDPECVVFSAEVHDEYWLTSGRLEAALRDQQIRLIDARGSQRFRGDSEPIDSVAGHVPGAVNLPFTGNLNDAGRFKDAQALKCRFEAVLGELPPERAVHMCGSGVTACHNLLAMELAGLQGSRLYAGSWSEWIADPDRAVAKACP